MSTKQGVTHEKAGELHPLEMLEELILILLNYYQDQIKKMPLWL